MYCIICSLCVMIFTPSLVAVFLLDILAFVLGLIDDLVAENTDKRVSPIKVMIFWGISFLVWIILIAIEAKIGVLNNLQYSPFLFLFIGQRSAQHIFLS